MSGTAQYQKAPRNVTGSILKCFWHLPIELRSRKSTILEKKSEPQSWEHWVQRPLWQSPDHNDNTVINSYKLSEENKVFLKQSKNNSQKKKKKKKEERKRKRKEREVSWTAGSEAGKGHCKPPPRQFLPDLHGWLHCHLEFKKELWASLNQSTRQWEDRRVNNHTHFWGRNCLESVDSWDSAVTELGSPSSLKCSLPNSYPSSRANKRQTAGRHRVVWWKGKVNCLFWWAGAHTSPW